MNILRSLCLCTRKIIAEKRGSIGVVSALTITMLLGMIGLGADVSVWYTHRHRVQTIAEMTALSAGRLLSDSTQTTTSITNVAKNAAVLNGLASSDSVSVSFTPSPPPNATGLTVKVGRTMPLMFSALFLNSPPSVTQSATVSNSGPSVCIYVVDPSSSQTLLVNSSFTLSAPKCEIDVSSTSSSAAMLNSGSTLTLSELCIAGGDTNNGATVSNLKTGCTVHSNPYTGHLTAPTIGSCTYSNQNYSGSQTLNPGTYCGSFNFNGSGTITLNAGTYIFNNATWNLNSGWTVNGTGVTFYFANSSSYVQFNSGVTVSLTAPTSGTNANILIFEPDGLSTSNIAIDGTSSSGHALQGVIYLPSRNLTFNSAYSGTADSFAMVVHQVIFDSNSGHSWSVSPIGSGATSGVVLTN